MINYIKKNKYELVFILIFVVLSYFSIILPIIKDIKTINHHKEIYKEVLNKTKNQNSKELFIYKDYSYIILENKYILLKINNKENVDVIIEINNENNKNFCYTNNKNYFKYICIYP